MRQIVTSTFVSLDGVVNRMEKWHCGYIHEESKHWPWHSCARLMRC